LCQNCHNKLQTKVREALNKSGFEIIVHQLLKLLPCPAHPLLPISITAARSVKLAGDVSERNGRGSALADAAVLH
jgi:hypothetical protein